MNGQPVEDISITGCISSNNLIKELYDQKLSQSTRILYGGSIKPENIKDLMKEEDIDGGLIGGASLKAENFAKIILNS